MGIMFNIIIILIILFVIFRGIHIVPQNYEGLIETFGKYKRTVQSGLVLTIPVVQKIRKVSMALQPVAIEKYSIITKDNSNIRVSLTLNYSVENSYKFFYNNTDSETSMVQLVRGHLRNIIGTMTLDEALGSTEKINSMLFDAVDGLTAIYGIKIARVNIDEIIPSKEIQEAMDKQLTADREKTAAIAKAQGTSESIKLENKAQNEATVATAEANAKAKKLAADAEKYRIDTIQEALNSANDSYFKNQSLNSFNQLAAGPNNLIVMDKDNLTNLGNLPVANEMLKKQVFNESNNEASAKEDN